MPGQTNGNVSRWSRRSYALLVCLYGLFVVYGSLVPLRFRAVAPARAVEMFRRVVLGPIVIDSHADLATNFILFVPLGYLLVATLRTDRRGWLGHAAAALFTAAFGAAVTGAVEFTQIFFPGRTVALSDMVAEAVGGITGTVLWLVAGKHATTWLRAFAHERERLALVQRLLLLYCLGFVVSQLLPLDLTLSLGDLAQKFRQGAIVLTPFGFSHASWLDAAWDYLGDIVLNAPLGTAAVLAWTAPGGRRRPAVAFAIAASAVALVELGQVFVMSRYADVTDLITGSLGAAIGVAMASALSERHVLVGTLEQPRLVTRFARMSVPLWLSVLAAYHWSPFDFSLAHEQVTEGMHRLLQVPFLSYYLGTEFHAFTEMARKTMLAVPLGALLGLAWPGTSSKSASRVRAIVLLGAAFGALCTIEVGQVFLRSRYPDLTDAFMGEIGVIAGLWVSGLIALPVRG